MSCVQIKINPPRAFWLPADKHLARWNWRLIQVRIEMYGKRIIVLPALDLDWECGMLTIGFAWGPFYIGIDYDVDPLWEESEESRRAKTMVENLGM